MNAPGCMQMHSQSALLSLMHLKHNLMDCESNSGRLINYTYNQYIFITIVRVYGNIRMRLSVCKSNNYIINDNDIVLNMFCNSLSEFNQKSSIFYCDG